MNKLERRKFLKQAAFGTGTLPAMGLLAQPLTAAGLQQGSRRGAPDATAVVHGRIISANGATLVVDTHEGLRVVITGVDSSPMLPRVWKGGNMDKGALRAADVIWAKGVEMPDKSIAATDIWANLVNVDGQVDTIISSTQFRLKWGRKSFDRITTVELTPATLINSGAGTANDIKVGNTMQVLGTAMDENGIVATRIWT